MLPVDLSRPLQVTDGPQSQIYQRESIVLRAGMTFRSYRRHNPIPPVIATSKWLSRIIAETGLIRQHLLDTDCPTISTAHMPEATTPHFRTGHPVTQLGAAAPEADIIPYSIYPLGSREHLLAIWLLRRVSQSGLARQSNLAVARQNTEQ